MINMQSVDVRQGFISANKAAAIQILGKSFAQYLESYEAAVPDKWCLDTDKFGVGVGKAVEYMVNSLGIDPYNKVPTHELTSEQTKWLKSRHDLNNIYKTESGGCKDGCCGWTMSWWDENFLSDLVYLNVISPDEAKSFGWIAFPESESGKVYAASECGSDNTNPERLSVTDVAAKVLQKQQTYIDRVYEKYGNRLSLMSKEDREFIETAGELLEKNRIWYDLLMILSD